MMDMEMRNQFAAWRRQRAMKLPALLFAGMMLVGACAPDATVPTSVPEEVEPALLLAVLGDARIRWASAAPSDYTVTETCGGCADQTLAVRSGEIVSLSADDQQTVDDIFTQIEDAIEEGAAVEASYDDDLGYPTSVAIDYDGDGVPEVDIQYDDLQAMPIVTTLEELLEARDRWEALGLDDYRYIFRADCTCSEEGTFQVTVIDSRVTEELPLDPAARESRQISPGSLDAAFDDLEVWFTDSSDLIDEGFLEVDVRMDPQFGYPRWFRVVGEGLEGNGPFAERFEIIVTTDLIGPIEPTDTTEPTIDQLDLAALVEASSRWEAAGLTDYRYEIEYHCECPVSARGPFVVTVRNGEVSSSEPLTDQSQDSTYAPTLTVGDLLDLIERAIQDGTDVDVGYDPIIGQPLDVIIDPEAVAVDGGLAFTTTPATVLDPLGFLDLRALAGPQCPVQQSPPDPECEDAPVVGADVVLTRLGSDAQITLTTDGAGEIFIAVEPGAWIITPQPVDGLLGTAAPIEVMVQSNQTTEVLAAYDTGIR